MDLRFRADLVRMFRSVMPGVAGVVLTTPAGTVRAHDVEDAGCADLLALEGLAGMSAGQSALVPHADRLYLVVRVPDV